MKIPPANVREGQGFFLNYLEMRCGVFDAPDGNGAFDNYDDNLGWVRDGGLAHRKGAAGAGSMDADPQGQEARQCLGAH